LLAINGVKRGGKRIWGLTGQEVFVIIVGGGRGEGVLAMGKHGVSVAGSKMAWLGTEVKEDGIGFPMAKSTNGHFINAGDKEGGGAPRAEAIGFDAVRRNVGERDNGSGGTAQFKRDIAW
jgi:hypothetical protein